MEKGHGQGPPPIRNNTDFDPGGNGSNGGAGSPLKNAFIAMLLFLGADLMFFAGLLGAFLVFRFGAENWPPPDQPRLPLGVTTLNTLVLLASGGLMIHTLRTLSSMNHQAIKKGLFITALLGSVFLLVQGYEWVRILGFGLTLTQGVFGATFYTLIGCHALHVIGAVVWLIVVLFRMTVHPDEYEARRFIAIKLAGMYWFLVVALWPFIYGLVYLS
ncbi:MAG: heme-copper oxidase subunit III [bacterium]